VNQNRIVVRYLCLGVTRGYPAAANELEELYRDPEVRVAACVKKALIWLTIKPDNHKALDEFGVFLSQCENVV